MALTLEEINAQAERLVNIMRDSRYISEIEEERWRALLEGEDWTPEQIAAMQRSKR
jgi:hypothetical protein